MKRILLAGGGTGGHIYPGLAIAETLHQRSEPANVFFAATMRPIDRRILSSTRDATIVTQPIAPFSLHPFRLARFATGWTRSYRQMVQLIRRERIDAVLGLGGFGSSAAIVAAGRLGVRRAVFNPDAVPGKANRLFGRRVDTVFVQWRQTEKFFDRPVVVVGCPVRRQIKALAGGVDPMLRDEALRTFGLQSGLKTLLILGGSTGARSVNRAVLKLLTRRGNGLPNDVQVLHISGSQEYATVKRRYAEHVSARHCVINYIDRMELAYALADLAVARSGAVALAELSTAGVPAVLMPYPYHRDQHQRANAMVLVEAGGATLVDDDGQAGEKTVGALSSALHSMLDDRERLTTMSARLRQLAKTDADEDIARWLMEG